jgi:hypothetical protein
LRFRQSRFRAPSVAGHYLAGSSREEGVISRGQGQHTGATGRVIANFAWQHLKAAATFRDHVVLIESLNTNREFGPFVVDIRSYGSACILSAVASLEALVNEFFITPEGPLRRQMNNFELEFWGDRKKKKKGIESFPALEKYKEAFIRITKQTMDEHTLQYMDAKALVDLRNALVHYKPPWDADRKRKVDLADALADKYELSPFPDAAADFVTMRSMSAGCMRWTISTVVRFMKEFHARTHLDGQKMSAFWTFDQD